MDATKLLGDLMQKEERLMDRGTRSNPTLLAQLMEDHCVDVSETGQRVLYRVGDTLKVTDGISYITTNSATISPLAPDCTLLAYTEARVVVDKQCRVWHSSIWKQGEQGWKRVYHQGTISNP